MAGPFLGQECEEGWKEVAQSFLQAELAQDVDGVAKGVLPSEQKAWATWKSWEWERLNRRISEMPEAVQKRAVTEREEEQRRLEVSLFTCEPAHDGKPDAYMVRIAPDGRSFRTLRMVREQGDFWVSTGLVVLNAEQRRVVTAYWEAVDGDRWNEAEAWVARQSLPRFRGYQLEVQRFLAGSDVLAEARKSRAAQRTTEWDRMFIRATKEEEDILVVRGEFPTATELDCELIQVDGTWRILHR